jgi:hypothetical protein
MSTPTSEVQDLEKATTNATTTTSATSIASQPSNDTLNSSNTSNKSSRYFAKRQGSVLSLESQRLKFSEVSASDVLSRSLQMLFAFMGMMGIIIFFSQWKSSFHDQSPKFYIVVAALSMILDGSLLLYFFVADIRVTLFSWTTMTQKMVLTLAADVVFIVLWILASIQVAGLTGTCVADNAKATSDGGSGFDCISLFATLLFGILSLIIFIITLAGDITKFMKTSQNEQRSVNKVNVNARNRIAFGIQKKKDGVAMAQLGIKKTIGTSSQSSNSSSSKMVQI